MTSGAEAATANPRVALVSTDDDERTALARYLRRAGFEVHECGELAVPRLFGALVLLDDETAGDGPVAQIRSWMKLTRDQRVVVVTPKPAALRELAVTHAGRLFVLPAPVFGWELVDALRATEPPGSRGA